MVETSRACERFETEVVPSRMLEIMLDIQVRRSVMVVPVGMVGTAEDELDAVDAVVVALLVGVDARSR